MDEEFYDGDSFVVKWSGQEYVFRLYFVDTPEHFQKGGFHKRTTEQAKYFRIYKRDLYTVAQMASDFTAKALSKRFTVWTRWEDARGQSKRPRFYGVVITAEGKDLAGELVSHGLARIHGVSTDTPLGSAMEMQKSLTEAEELARLEKRGGWSFIGPGKK